MAGLLFRHAAVLDVLAGVLIADRAVLVQDGRIAAIEPDGAAASASAEVEVADLAGRTLMPGLIDCHVHVTAASAHLAQIEEWSPMYLAAHAGAIAREMLQRGFTTVRDAGGADFGIARAIDEGLLDGPNVVFGGHALSQTGGHGDGRSRGRTALESGYSYTAMGRICDGVAEVRRAVREE